MSQFQIVGKVKDAHGLKGHLFVIVFSKDTTWINKLSQIQLKTYSNESKNQDRQSGKKQDLVNSTSETLVLQVEDAKTHKSGLILKLKTIENRNQSEKLKNYSFAIPEELITSEVGETIYLKEVLDFEVFLKDQFVGFVKEFSSNGVQDLLVIRYDDHLFEVPFVSDFILDINFEDKKLYMNFPEDLMNLDKID